MRLGGRVRERVAGVALERRRVEVGPVTFAYGRAGSGPPLVLIHGLGGSTRWWAKNVGPLAEQCEVYVVDLVGFGESRGRRRFVLAEAAGQLAALLDRLGVGPAGVVGYSMGGCIAAELAADFPDCVSRLVLVDAALLPADFLSLRQTLNLARAARRVPLGLLPTMVADALRAGPATVWRATRELLAADLRPKLRRIQAPTLVVWGDRDVVVPLATGQQIVQDLPHGELAIIPGAGHVPMWERPEVFNRLVADFVNAGTASPRPPDAEATNPGGAAFSPAADCPMEPQ